jgi:protease IV
MAKLNDDTKNKTKKFSTMMIILASLFLASLMISLFISIGDTDQAVDYNTAIIPIKGIISAESSGGIFGDEGAGSTETIKLIEKAVDDTNVHAIIFEINSPGGSPVATDEISTAIKKASENNITTVAWIRETGTSGAYWVASSTDYIVANRMSIVGSIGVYGSYIEWYGLMQDYNVTYKRLVSGEYKDTGVPFRPLSDNEEAYIQEKLDKLRDHFIKEVALNRELGEDSVKKLANGQMYLGMEAIDNGLIDELGGKDEAFKFIEQELNITVKAREFSKQKSFIENIINAMNMNSFYIGKGISSNIVESQGLSIVT